ncbi:hypothetical protein [Cellulomonas cellasea]|uniref:Uncharacterized protein n=1 Tax=Cellulomonas cellasea TaxID=43670 RepID=A0A7W4YD67_9CELL|nr:hypothetical protein [Cellulomonas cellasea]MBB2924397.1 hypothetical protein [Cellulomonas cellasea]
MQDPPIARWHAGLPLRVAYLCLQVGLTVMLVVGHRFSGVDAFGLVTVSAVNLVVVVLTGQFAQARLDLYPGQLLVRNLVRQHEIGGSAVQGATLGPLGLKIVAARRKIPVLALQTANHELPTLETTRAYQVGAYLTHLVPRLVDDDPTGGRIRTTPAWPSVATIACVLSATTSLLVSIL